MVELTEGQLEFSFTSALGGIRFDDPTTHQLSIMKAVDFVVEFEDYYLFVEVKDPDDTTTTSENFTAFRTKLTSGKLENNLKYKYRDSFLYRYACGKDDKPIKYVVLLEMQSLSARDYQLWTDKLKRGLPVTGPASWSRQIVNDAWVLNMATWNQIGAFGSVRRR